MKIGDVEIQGRVVLGPMAGVTSEAYRCFMKPFGVALSFTEMVSDCGLDYGNARTYEYLPSEKTDRPLGLQLFGFSVENTAKAVSIAEKNGNYDVLDINLGCPVPKVVKTGAGSSWLRRPEELEAYMKAVVEASSKPVTAKIRLGWDEESINVFDVALRLQRAGVQGITVHCRTRVQGYAGEADYRAIAGLKEQLSIPLIVSGDIFTAQKAKEALDITHADAVMIARGGLGHPFLATQINTYLETGELLDNPPPEAQAEYALDFATRLIEQEGEATAIKQLKGLIPHFFAGFPGYKKIRTEIASKVMTQSQLFRVLEGIKKRKGC